MVHRRSAVLRAVVGVSCLIPGPTHAAPSTPLESTQTLSPPMDLALTAEPGASVYDHSSGPSGVHFGATGLVRIGVVGVGLSVDADKAIIFKSTSSSQLSLVAGLATRSVTGVRFDVLGSFGWHSYDGWGASEYGTDKTFKGASASEPCAGARVRILYSFSKQRRVHFLIGGQLGLDLDLEKHQGISYDNGGVQESRAVGGVRAMAGLVLGAAFDIGHGEGA